MAAVLISELEVKVEAPDDHTREAGRPPRPETGRPEQKAQMLSPNDILAVLRYYAAREERLRAH